MSPEVRNGTNCTYYNLSERVLHTNIHPVCLHCIAVFNIHHRTDAIGRISLCLLVSSVHCDESILLVLSHLAVTSHHNGGTHGFFWRDKAKMTMYNSLYNTLLIFIFIAEQTSAQFIYIVVSCCTSITVCIQFSISSTLQ